VPVVFGLGGTEGFGEAVVVELGIDDPVAVLDQVGRFDALRKRLPAVEEENGHAGSFIR
jgi:hypothetical protein